MKKILIVGGLLFCGSVADAQPPVPAGQWTPDTHIWLARAMVAEAGWHSNRDHVAIAHVLARRWHRARDRWPTLRFLDVIRNYCAGLGDYRRSLTPRQKWLRALDFEVARPSGWPRRVSWKKHSRYWRGALKRSQRWAAGAIKDPCRGKAWHWGGTIDSPYGRMVAVDCGETRNTFYGMSPKH